MRVFITGAGGFLGSRLVAQLLKRGDQVHALVRDAKQGLLLSRAQQKTTGRLEVHLGDLAHLHTFSSELHACDVVYHLAAAMVGPAATLFLNNVVHTRTLLDICREQCVQRFVLVSSLAVYGTGTLPKWSILDESCRLDPEPHRRDLYTYSKVAQEKAAWEAYHEGGLPLVVIRPGVIYGPGRDCLTARVGLKFGKCLLRLGGRQSLPYTHVENCAQAVLLAGVVPGVEGDAFNVVDDGIPSARQLVRLYRQTAGPIRVLPLPGWAIGPLSGANERYHRWSHGQLPAVLTRYKSDAMWKPLRYSNSKAKARLGWKPGVGTDQGLKHSLESLGARESADGR
jgi:nucleoside-diphosphate-sugar epimerase